PVVGGRRAVHVLHHVAAAAVGDRAARVHVRDLPLAAGHLDDRELLRGAAGVGHLHQVRPVGGGRHAQAQPARRAAELGLVGGVDHRFVAGGPPHGDRVVVAVAGGVAVAVVLAAVVVAELAVTPGVLVGHAGQLRAEAPGHDALREAGAVAVKSGRAGGED